MTKIDIRQFYANDIFNTMDCIVYNKKNKPYWVKRVHDRLSFLEPLIAELCRKDIKLKDISNELNQEYLELLDVKQQIHKYGLDNKL